MVKPDGSACDLTPLEFQLLLFLMRNPGRFYSTEELYFNVWGRNSYGDARTVIVLVHGIRGKIEPNQKEPRYLVNRRGRGYAFMPHPEVAAAETPDSAPDSTVS